LDCGGPPPLFPRGQARQRPPFFVTAGPGRRSDAAITGKIADENQLLAAYEKNIVTGGGGGVCLLAVDGGAGGGRRRQVPCPAFRETSSPRASPRFASQGGVKLLVGRNRPGRQGPAFFAGQTDGRERRFLAGLRYDAIRRVQIESEPESFNENPKPVTDRRSGGEALRAKNTDWALINLAFGG
jgi:hypothetical protein